MSWLDVASQLRLGFRIWSLELGLRDYFPEFRSSLNRKPYAEPYLKLHNLLRRKSLRVQSAMECIGILQTCKFWLGSSGAC